MSSSGVYTFAPDYGDFLEEGFERTGLNPAKLTQQHFTSALRSINLLFSSWANEGIHLFTVEEATQALTVSDHDYSVAAGTLAILEAVVRRSGVDTPVHRITREQYHLIPDKTTEGMPSSIYLDRKTGTYFLWQVPENSTDVLRFYRVRQIQSATAGQETPDLPFRWYEALASGLSEYLALKYAPDRHDKLRGLAAAALKSAKAEDRERSDTSFGMGSF